MTSLSINDIIEGIKNPGTITKEILIEYISNLSLTDLETIASNLQIAYSDLTYEHIKNDLAKFFTDYPKFSDCYFLENPIKDFLEKSILNLTLTELQTIATNLSIDYSNLNYDELKGTLLNFFINYSKNTELTEFTNIYKSSGFCDLNNNLIWEPPVEVSYDSLQQNELIIYFIKNIFYNNFNIKYFLDQ
jgi:hypothetical protein